MSTPRPEPSIAAVVVTHNRLALLQECIVALRSQTRKPDEIIVVNNASTDGTAEWLAQQPDVTVITQENLGSSGGQYTGIKTAYHKGHDWFWCMDDDTIPEPSALERLAGVPYFRVQETGFLCSVVINKDGSPPGICPVPGNWCRTVLQDRCIQVNMAGFLAVLIRRQAVEKVGLPYRDFFIWADDLEFTYRISCCFKCYTVLDSIVIHKASELRPFGDSHWEKHSLFKYLHGLRNGMVWIRRQEGIGRIGRLLTVIEIYANQLYRWRSGKMSLKALALSISWLTRGLLWFPRVEYLTDKHGNSISGCEP